MILRGLHVFPVICRLIPTLSSPLATAGTFPSMSYPNTPPSPSPEPPKAPYEFDVAKWEHQQMAENGGNERTSYLALDPLGTHDSSPALVVSIICSSLYLFLLSLGRALSTRPSMTTQISTWMLSILVSYDIRLLVHLLF